MTDFTHCCRSACKFPLKHGRRRIWNNPGTEPPYRDYCIACGRKIMEYNQALPADQHMRNEIIPTPTTPEQTK